MEESKELQGFYKIFRSVIYISILLEFFEYAITPSMLDHWGGVLCDICLLYTSDAADDV